MRSPSIAIPTILLVLYLTTTSSSHPPSSASTIHPLDISLSLFNKLEELARIVDISYCVGTTGISKPFLCASRCSEFPSFELVDTFNTGPLMSDSCGYIAVDHGVERAGGVGKKDGNGKGRILVVFRGTYSIANTIVDLSTIPQEYIPYPDEPDHGKDGPPAGDGNSQHHGKHSFFDWLPRWRRRPSWFFFTTSPTTEAISNTPARTCSNCTVHYGFWKSWQNTRDLIVPHLQTLRTTHPDYELHLVGHSLGGAVALLAGLEFEGRGWNPTVTTFGEPRVGNKGLREWVDWSFGLTGERDGDEAGEQRRYRRVTHVDDPVPLLPLHEWGYRSHAGEVYISKPSLQPSPSDLRICYGDNDASCIGGAEPDAEEMYLFLISAFSKLKPSPPLDLTTPETALHKYQAQLLRLLRARKEQHLEIKASRLQKLLDSPTAEHERVVEILWRHVVHDEETGECDTAILDALLDMLETADKAKQREKYHQDEEDDHSVLSATTSTTTSSAEHKSRLEDRGYHDQYPAEVAEARARHLLALNARWGIPIPARYKIWQLFFAHRDYFWRLGLCVPGGDPWDWGREGWRGRDDIGDRDVEGLGVRRGEKSRVR